MSIRYRQYTDSILNYLQNHHLWRKNGKKLVLHYLKNSKLPTKSSFVEKKMVKIGTILSRKSSKDPSWLAMCNVYFRNELLTALPARSMPFSIRVTSCRYELAVILLLLCIDIAMSNRHVISFREYSANRYFRQSITAQLILTQFNITSGWTWTNKMFGGEFRVNLCLLCPFPYQIMK